MVTDLAFLALADPFLKRYTRGYVALALILMTFDHLVDEVATSIGSVSKVKYDLKQIVKIHSCLVKVIGEFFGHHKYIFGQTLANFLSKRFRVLFYQHSGIIA